MEYWEDGKLHGSWRYINENKKKTWTERSKLVPEAGIPPAKFQLKGPSRLVKSSPTQLEEKTHIQLKLEKEAKRTQNQLDEQSERIIKFTKEVEDSQEEVRSIRQKASEEKKKLYDERDQLNEKILNLGNKLLDTERSLSKERENLKKFREEHNEEVERYKKEQEKSAKYWQDRESKYLSQIDELNQFKIAFESRKRKEINDMMEEMSKLREENRSLTKSAMEFKTNVDALEENTKLYERRYYALEKSNDDRMKSYEEQIYALTQELKIKNRDLNKLTNDIENLDVKCIRAENNEKSALEQLTEANKAYTDIVTKHGELEEKNANLRAEIIRVTKERNEAEALSHKKKLKAKILLERLKTIENNLQDKIKECVSRTKTNARYKKLNEDLQDNLSKTEAKLKYTTNNQIKEMEKLLGERDSEVQILKQLIKSNEIQIRTKDKDINHLKNKVRNNESRNISQYFINTIDQPKKNFPKVATYGSKPDPYQMITDQINSIPDDFDENKQTKKKFKDIILDQETKAKTYDKPIGLKDSVSQVQLKPLVSITSRNENVRATGTFDRNEIVFSPDSIRSPKGLKISKRKMKLTDSDIKQISKEINTIKKVKSSSRYESSYQDDFANDPNDKIADAAEMGYEYQPDFEENRESREAKEITKRNLISPEAVHEYEKGQVLFNRSSHSFNKSASISEGSAKNTPKKVKNPNPIDNKYELPKIQNAEFEHTDSAEDNKEQIRISEDVSETIPQEKYNLPDIDNQAQENEKEAKKDRKKSKHRKHKHRKEKKEKKDKRAKADNDYEDDEFEQDAE